ncbi:MAG: nucleotide exchange factor GrpE [Planctomycetes bacterium]|nr:nucleotide exchange factor GrpE [Planctomycetota bacterium]
MSDEKKTSESASQEKQPAPPTETEALRAKADEYLKMAQRVQADFSNYQKRVVRDRDGEARFLVEKLLQDLLPALDTFSLALGQAPAGAESFVKGMQLAEREIFRKLELHGVKRIAATGAFSPGVHEALMQVATDEKPEGDIVAEMRPGYMLHERVIRPAQVSVAVKPGKE